ncbi:hypothetical protein Lqui_0699 [Legionella quinlivanii]|uniref:DUF4142 domain-containing protein n=1 Tax=Legionella quinlivanii TaxID=45073 RepID=A0A0W0Y5B2_9GAMM|nr:DUF4142 domain-containing protein [Legionella quinlivanii]KTD51855.1 hypothetical protein Lqui_0699 [Legionella quinlivanii]MCW8452115.1 DUF4142 domain-containing protein [Legionella quinlivanii]SEF82984.1 protein of unknown function [Legionella quinlivanii DSM 21216]STY09684.1 Predicted outer membrane protein [Legionella quinlivanii]
MKTKMGIICLLLLGLLQIAAVNQHSVLGPLPQQQDGAVLANLLVINENQSALARYIYKKSNNSIIQQFALKLDQQARHHLKEIYHLSKTTGISTIDAATALKLRGIKNQELKALSEAENSQLDSLYLEFEIRNSSKALTLFEQDFKPIATHPAIKNYLESSKQDFVENLKQAQLIQKTLGAH